MRSLLAVGIGFLMLLLGAALAQDVSQQPMIPQMAPAVGPAGGAMIPGSGIMVPNILGASAPPTCSNELDFTQACNSQYMGIF